MGTRSAASMSCLVPLESQAAQEGGLGGEGGEPHGWAPSDSEDVKGVNIGQIASCLSAQGSASIRAPVLLENCWPQSVTQEGKPLYDHHGRKGTQVRWHGLNPNPGR